jgi:PAS domain S-box-containing protein
MRHGHGDGTGHGEGEVANPRPPSTEDERLPFWRQALRASPQNVFALDLDGRIIAVSGTLAGRLGLEVHDIIGRRCHTLLHRSGAAPDECPFRSLVLDGSQHEADVHCDVLGGDFFVTVTPFPDGDGRLGGAVHTAYDVSERKRMETALHESEARYRTVVENAPIGMFQTTPEGKPVYSNPCLAELFGYASPEELFVEIDKSSLAEALYADPSRRREFVEELRLAGGDWRVLESAFRRKDGSHFEALLACAERRELTSGQAHLYGFVQDVTEERRARRELEKRSAQLEEAERLAHLGTWEWDSSARTLRTSEEWRLIHGCSEDQISIARMRAMAHPGDASALAETMSKAVHRGGRFEITYRLVRENDGEVRQVTTYGRAEIDKDGRVERIFGATQDVTEWAEAQEALRDREQRLRQALVEVVDALGATVGQRDSYTAGHEHRVALLACRIAERMGWDEARRQELRTAALVHDVGKISVPAEILSKPSHLDAVEFELVKRHPQAAYDILAPISFDGAVAEIVLQHHERLDGSGYPAGLRGDQILPAACVLAVADVVEAIITHRPYRPALTIMEAAEELRSGMGVLYEEEASAACLALLEMGSFSLAASG